MNIKEKLTSKAHIFIAVLLIIQPLLNVTSFWFTEWNFPSSITLVLRLLVLMVTVLYAYTVSNKKTVYWVMVGALAVVYALHAMACFIEGYNDIVADIANYVRVIQMPVSAICFITLLKENKQAYRGLQIGLSSALLIMLAVMLLATVTGTDPHTYTDGKGVLGWFNNTNTQSTNLSLLVPVSLGWQLTWKNKKSWKNQLIFWSTAVLGFLAMFFFCTRLAYLGILATSFGLAVVLLIINRKEWLRSLILLACSAIFVVLIPFSPMMNHNDNDNAWQAKVQGWANSKIENADKIEESKNNLMANIDVENTEDILTKEELIESLTPLYEWKVPDFVEIFGHEGAMELFNYTTDVNVFTDIRAKKIMFAETLMDDSKITAQLFGLEISRFTVYIEDSDLEGIEDVYIYDVENDFHGIYYLYGWTGLALYIAFIGYFLYLVAWALIKNAKKYFTIEAASIGIGLVMCLIHAYYTAGILRRPDASIFLSAILAAIYYLVKIKDYENE